jgi:protein arginine kinase
MKLDDLLTQTSEWLRGTGPNSDIVISSRIRLARNLDKIPFSHWANKKQEADILNKAKVAIFSSNYMKNGLFLNLNELNNIDKQFLIERHLISKEHALKTNHKAVVISDKEIVSIMINEEDHLRIQVIQSGFNLTEAWRVVSKIDAELEKKLKYAFSPDWGYLTACPTNTGTGIRASVMLHLPSLVMIKQINKVLQAIAKLSLTARGFYGEGTQASGNFFQISNQITLGQREEDIIDNLQRVIKQIIEHEQNARRTLLSQRRENIEDRVWRAYGTLKTAHIITSQETIELLSLLRLGINTGIIKDITAKMVNDLFILIQPAHLQKLAGRVLSPTQRDVKRATLIRERLNR